MPWSGVSPKLQAERTATFQSIADLVDDNDPDNSGEHNERRSSLPRTMGAVIPDTRSVRSEL
jgi:hypothetical protein